MPPLGNKTEQIYKVDPFELVSSYIYEMLGEVGRENSARRKSATSVDVQSRSGTLRLAQSMTSERPLQDGQASRAGLPSGRGAAQLKFLRLC